MTARIIGIGAYAPEQVVTNQDLTKFLDTNDAWIRERTGIGARHVSTSEGTSALATEAAKRAIADAGISPEEIEIVIVATSSPDRAFPSAAADVQGAIGAKHAVAFDITAACSGFIYALHIVQGFIQAGIYKTALIIGAVRRWIRRHLQMCMSRKNRRRCRRLSLKRRMKLQQMRRLPTQKQKARLVQTRIPRMLRTLFRRTPPILRHRMKITAGSRHNLWIHWYNGLQLIYPELYRRRQLSSLSR